MLISQAVAEAMKTNSMITREKYKGFGIKPTDLHETLMIFSETNEKPPAKAWQPFASDLVAEDWEVIY